MKRNLFLVWAIIALIAFGLTGCDNNGGGEEPFIAYLPLAGSIKNAVVEVINESTMFQNITDSDVNLIYTANNGSPVAGDTALSNARIEVAIRLYLTPVDALAVSGTVYLKIVEQIGILFANFTNTNVIILLPPPVHTTINFNEPVGTPIIVRIFPEDILLQANETGWEGQWAWSIPGNPITFWRDYHTVLNKSVKEYWVSRDIPANANLLNITSGHRFYYIEEDDGFIIIWDRGNPSGFNFTTTIAWWRGSLANLPVNQN